MAQLLKRILSLDSEAFINAVFEAILRRSPDPEGLRHYLSWLETRGGKQRVILDVYGSPEARVLPQREDVAFAVYRLRHPFRSRFRRAPRSDHAIHPSGEHINVAPIVDGNASGGISDARVDDVLNAIHSNGNMIQKQLLQIEYRLDNASRVDADEILGDGNTRYLFNLSTSNQWRGHAVGIIRVEREIATYLNRFRNVDYVLWDAKSGSLRRLARIHADRILAPEWCAPSTGQVSYDAASLEVAVIRPGDTYVSLGLDWDHAPTGDVLRYLRPYGTKVILTCYDTVPAQFPEFLVRNELFSEFRQHLVDMAHGATKVWAISEATKRDLTRFWEKAGLERRPPEIFTVPLATYAVAAIPPPLGHHDDAILRETFARSEYVLYVSSIEPRKNHKLLLDVWRDLWTERGDDCPQLVYVGMMGWGSNDMRQRIARMPAYAGGKINGLHSVSDDLLVHLYRHASFTVFPSLYEGWGLAATEAMALGKVCVVANNSSLEEATQGLMPAYHPLDFPRWKAEIERLIDDLPYRQSLEDKITSQYQAITWQDVGERFCRNMLLDSEE